MIYDAMIVLAMWLLTLFIGVAIHNGAVVGPLVQTILFVEMFSFFAYFWVGAARPSACSRGICVVETSDGTPMRLGQALLRFVGAMLSFATLGIGYLWIYVDPDRRAWPDMLSRTHIVHPTRARLIVGALLRPPQQSQIRSSQHINGRRHRRPPRAADTPCSSARACPRGI